MTAPAIERLNALPEAQARAALTRCCGAARWVTAMLALRPFTDAGALYAEAGAIWSSMQREDILEAFAHHPKIGDIDSLRKRFAATAGWSGREQAGVAAADDAVLRELAEGNAAYEARFGHIFIVCATGKSAAEMLAILRARLGNTPADELRIAADEQAKIMRIRLEKLLAEG